WTARAAEIRDLLLSDTEGRAYARMFFGKAEPVTLDGQRRLLVPERISHEAGIGKEAVVLGVSDRMEIWDRTAHERYEAAHAGAYQAGTLAPGARGGHRGRARNRCAGSPARACR